MPERIRGRAAAKPSDANAVEESAPSESVARARPTPAEQLAAYAKKRRFDATPEPSGENSRIKPSTSRRLRFVIQMHRATRLHWDFRLEADGVLKSWAVPKGPTLDPAEKRFAAHVEDHPLDYREFEGIIPRGNYGAGEVVVWDRGTYRLLEGTDVAEQIAKGSLKFELFGEKVHGGFALVRMKGRDGEENAWLLIKERDDSIDRDWNIEDYPESVKSGKTLADFAADPNAPHWISNRPESAASAPSPTKTRIAAAAHAAEAAVEAPKTEPVSKRAARRTEPGSAAPTQQTVDPIPSIASPMLAVAVEHAFDDDRWLFELKWDGYRAIVRIDADGTVRLDSRNALDLTPRFPELRGLAAAFADAPIVVDGEIVVLDENGRASFAAIQERSERFRTKLMEAKPATFVAFDLLYAGGRDLRREPLEARKAKLEALMRPSTLAIFSKHIVGEGVRFFEIARAQALEGIVGKRRDSPYSERRTRDWVKLKTSLRQEVVVGGWTESKNGRRFRAILVGTYEGGQLVFAGALGSGFDAQRLERMEALLKPLQRPVPPFVNPPKTETRAHWVEPKLVVEAEFAEWTRDGIMRQPRFIGVREDKDPRDVVREVRADDALGSAPAEASDAGDSDVENADERGKADYADRPRNVRGESGETRRDEASGVSSADASDAEDLESTEDANGEREQNGVANRAPKRPRTVRTTRTIDVGGRTLVLSNESKVLWPEDGITKGDLIAYYREVAPYIIPHLARRPLTVQRYPDGIDGTTFFEKHKPKGTPEWVHTVRVPSDRGHSSFIEFMVCDDEASLVYVANLAAIVLHVWTSKVEALDVPEFVFFDLDPFDGCTLATLAETALALRAALSEIGLEAHVKSSGGSGLHVAVPLVPHYTYPVAKAFAEVTARELHRRLPKTTTLERMPAKRTFGSVYLDYVQVGEGKTLVAAYSARPRAKAPVSFPLDWSEVEAMARKRAKETEGEFERFTIKNVPRLLAERGDLWGAAVWREQELDAAIARAQTLWR